MKILFCNITRMKYYKGIYKDIDEPEYGGEYISLTGDAYEKHNFYPVEVDGEKLCFGFVETKSTNKKTANQLHIENIEDCPSTDKFISDVLVVWCSKTIRPYETAVLGWYKNTTVYRNFQPVDIDCFQNKPQSFNVKALAENCVLLPEPERNVGRWRVPRKTENKFSGFGQANVWFATDSLSETFVNRIIRQIENYDGENWLYKFPVSN